ncbi:hypothetical protein N7463_007407 [Penicillium fimorum]|uniref:Uncharacterized protein n=1 Tax=Penicillium fimorum TaxID=1882269 RepID=A0A9W9XWC5_9EURO|nr:hypothetical protein N7463_007407 [Penicillium fimorum]
MTSSLPWFRKGTDPKPIITLDKLLSSRWKILEKLNDLGDSDGAGPFWGLESYEREQVRVSFLKALVKLKEYGWYPSVDRARSLVWHRETQTLYFIGHFSKTMEGKPRHSAEPAQRIATFGLALPDVPVRWKDWDKDTSRWKW